VPSAYPRGPFLTILHKKCLGSLAGVSHNAGRTRGSCDNGVLSGRTGSARGSVKVVLMEAVRAVEVGNLQGPITVRSRGIGMLVVVEEETEVSQSKSRVAKVSRSESR